ncbi:MAG: AmmeMemoRadiSam system protein B [Anaerolineales bacterium]|nr:AmmeMemoRadiSam system protein B [Anaerolineales bacterium]
MNTIVSTVRAPAVAGRFYPADAVQLERVVRNYAGRRVTTLKGVCGLIAPHAGYACSGGVAGNAYAALAALERRARVVYVMGPAHWKAVHGVAFSGAQAFATPLGEAPIAHERIAEPGALTAKYGVDDAAHAPEHCLEVQLPFLQVTLGEFSFVPMLFDDEADLEAVGDDLAQLLERHPEDLVVVSSDLSHYHAYQDAVNTDASFLKALATGDESRVNVGRRAVWRQSSA